LVDLPNEEFDTLNIQRKARR